MRRLLITIAVVGLILAVLASDSLAIRPPARDVAIPIWLGDPDQPAYSRRPGLDEFLTSEGTESSAAPGSPGARFLLIPYSGQIFVLRVRIPAACAGKPNAEGLYCHSWALSRHHGRK